MANFWLVVLFALLGSWLAVGLAGRWERRHRVLRRINSGTAPEEVPRNSILGGLSSRLTESTFMRNDYKEAFQSLRVTGRDTDQIQVLYLLICWLLPVVLLLVGALAFGALGALFLTVAGFLGSRRYIRTMAKRACYQQNLESIDLAQMLAMLLESGLSIERAFRIAAVQARPLVPSLVFRLDRFNRLMDSGAHRGAALDDMGGDKSIPTLHNLSRLLKQAGALGGGIGESLEQLIEEARDKERSEIKEQVNRVGAKMTVVMMVFMMPALFIIIGGPAGMNIVQALSR